MVSLYDDYESYVLMYQKEYGLMTVVAYQCGGFYEVYSINDGIVNIKDISELLNIQVSKRNKNIPEVSRSNSLMAGWPLHAMGKFMQVLVDNNYTVVLVEQVSPPPNPKREVTKVVSKGTVIDGISISTDSRYTMAIYVDSDKSSQSAIGIAIVDVTTGKTYVHECYSNANDSSFAMDDALRICVQYNPCEVILISDLCDSAKEKTLSSSLHLQRAHVINWLNNMDVDMKRTHNQNQLLAKVFPNTGMLSQIEFANLERSPYALLAFVTLIRYLYRHNTTLVSKLLPPEQQHGQYDPHPPLVLSHNAAEQLDAPGLLKILNQSVTSMGKRYFKQRLMNPHSDHVIISESHAMVEAFVSSGVSVIEYVRSSLKRVYDIERLFRRLMLFKLFPSELASIFESIQVLQTLIGVFSSDLHFKQYMHRFEGAETSNESVKKFLEFMSNNIDLEECAKHTQEEMLGSFFRAGIYAEVDEALASLQQQKFKLDAITVGLNNVAGSNFFKLEQNDRDGLFLMCTSKRYNDNKAKLQNVKLDDGRFDFASVKSTALIGSSVKLRHVYLDNLNENMNSAQQNVSKAMKVAFTEFIASMISLHEKDMHAFCKHLSECDFYSTCAHVAIHHKYVKPQISLSQSRKSFMKCTDLRHPIVEIIQEDIPYVANDIVLGCDNSDGLLLYGLNAAGKSTLMKSIAIAVWMAQSGMYVPASSLVFHPYTTLFTRITRGDDIYTGQSTFMIEMSELRNILRRSNSNSLIIGDELCSGTENASAIGIVSAGVATLASIGASFVFATHFHDLTRISLVEKLDNVKVKHLHVEFESASKRLVYDRKLRDGQGATTYGIEVCRSLNLGSSFIDMAQKARREYMDEEVDILSCKESSYNSKLKVSKCSVCGCRGMEVHHIQQQKDSDEHGFIHNSHVHKNRLSNLVVLCDKCHDQVHAKAISIDGFVQTSNGKVLMYEQKTRSSVNSTSILSTNHANDDTIRDLRFTEKLSIQKISIRLDISEYKVRQALKRISCFNK